MRSPRKWTADRVALMRAEYATSTDATAFLDRLNAMPGKPITSINAVSMMAYDLGLKKAADAMEAIQRKCGRIASERNLPRGAARTPEREALVRAEYATATEAGAFLDKVNSLPGPPFATTGTLRQWAHDMGLRKDEATHRTIKRRAASANIAKARAALRIYVRKEKPTPVPLVRKAAAPRPKAPPMRRGRIAPPVIHEPAPQPVTVEQSPEIADRAVERKHAMARRMLAKKIAADKVRATTGLPMREVFRLAGELRSERAGA